MTQGAQAHTTIFCQFTACVLVEAPRKVALSTNRTVCVTMSQPDSAYPTAITVEYWFCIRTHAINELTFVTYVLPEELTTRVALL